MTQRFITTQAIHAFKEHLIENEKAHATIQKYMHDIGHFAEYAAGQPLNKSAILRYKEMLAQNYAVRSANSMLAALNAFLRFAGWQDLCVKQFKMQPEAYCSQEKEITKAEYASLIRAAEQKKDERLSLVVQTICGTGIRVSELEYVTVEAAKRGEALVCCKGKTRKVFIVRALQKKLLQYVKKQGLASGPVFVSGRGKPLDRSNIWRQMKALCSLAGVAPKKVFPHNLRHLFARVFYRMERDLAKLADILGHANINTTRIYIIATGAEHRQRMEHMRLIL